MSWQKLSVTNRDGQLAYKDCQDDGIEPVKAKTSGLRLLTKSPDGSECEAGSNEGRLSGYASWLMLSYAALPAILSCRSEASYMTTDDVIPFLVTACLFPWSLWLGLHQ